MTATERYICILTEGKNGELSLLRTHAGQGLDESVEGFDLFTGFWWPLRQQGPNAPRRSVAWLVAKLYAAAPVRHSPGDTLARQLAHCQPSGDREKERFRGRFDRMLLLPLNRIEPALRWAAGTVSQHSLGIDWVKLTDDLSIWERESTRLRWAEQFLGISKGDQHAD